MREVMAVALAGMTAERSASSPIRFHVESLAIFDVTKTVAKAIAV
jgi:hypothetical protein